MSILNEITDYKRNRIAELKKIYPVALLEKSLYFRTPSVSLKEYLLREDKSGIIAEFKRQSPSKGPINPYARIESVSIRYMQAGSSALSVLTDEKYFDGRNSDLTEARKFNFCPILRKDFVVDPYQIVEAKSIGADAILLISECLSRQEIEEFTKLAKELGMEVVLEMHSADQLDKINDQIDIVGVNNRNLKTFTTDIEISRSLISLLPEGLVKISESGISDPRVIIDLKERGYQGFLIGEYFMKSADPGRSCEYFVQQLRILESQRYEHS